MISNMSERTPILGERKTCFLRPNSGRKKLALLDIFRSCLCMALLAISVTALLTVIILHLAKKSPDDVTAVNDSSDAPSIYKVKWPIEDAEERKSWHTGTSNGIDIQNAFILGLKVADERKKYENKFPKIQPNSISHRHLLSTATSNKARQLSKYGLILETGIKALTEGMPLRGFSERALDRSKLNGTNWLPMDICTVPILASCTSLSYRTADGSCNNLLHPRDWGVGMKPFRRILIPDYSDGISAPRKSSVGELPSAREVSLKVHRAIYAKDLDFTVMLAVWGQFVDHDMTSTALSTDTDGGGFACCGQKEVIHPECFPVHLGPQDPFYKTFNITCLDFVRSAPAPLCEVGPREQLNQASSFIDGSAIYGSSDLIMNNLRTLKNGEMKMLSGPYGEELLPVSVDVNDGCNREEEFKRGRYCFLTGDTRSNENLLLTSMHLIFARHHNKVARKLVTLNGHWSDEKVFQESRKIVIAQIQHITYREFLTAVLPKKLMDSLNITLLSSGHFTRYDSSVNPGISNVFAACAFRFGHSLLPGLMKIITDNKAKEEYMELHKMLFNPFRLYDRGFLEGTIMGILNTTSERSDVYFNSEVSGKLFQDTDRKRESYGLDLVSLNIQRGRDHGIPAYPAWRKHCGLTSVKSFDDLRAVFDSDSLANIKMLYDSVFDIDLFTGGLAEIPLSGSLLGPTFTCLLADQFLRLKIGDRYWYENPSVFTSGQLREIRKSTLARILCDNSYINSVQPMVMKSAGFSNRRKLCSQIPVPNFYLWKN